MGLFMYKVLICLTDFSFFSFIFLKAILLECKHVSLQNCCLSFPYFILDQNIYQIHLKHSKLVLVWVNDAHITPANKGELHQHSTTVTHNVSSRISCFSAMQGFLIIMDYEHNCLLDQVNSDISLLEDSMPINKIGKQISFPKLDFLEIPL